MDLDEGCYGRRGAPPTSAMRIFTPVGDPEGKPWPSSHRPASLTEATTLLRAGLLDSARGG